MTLSKTEQRLVAKRIVQDGRSLDFRVTLRQIGTSTFFAVSGGRYAVIEDAEGFEVGVILPVGECRAVEVVLGWNDLYIVRRVRLVTSGARRGEVVIEHEVTDLYFDSLPDQVYTASCWK